MSKRTGNVVAPWDVIDRYGADALPLVLLHLQAAVGRLPLLARDGRRGVRQFLLQLWNTYAFYVLYANADERRRGRRGDARPSSTAGSCRGCSATVAEVTRAARRTTTRRPPAARSPTFVDDLSNWYVRRSRRRFWDGRPARPFATLQHVPRHASRSCSRRSRRSSPTRSTATSTAREPSVHLSDWPERRRARRRSSRTAMAVAARDGRARAGGARRRRRSRCASRCARPSSSPPAREREAIERLADRRARGAERQGAALRRGGRRARLLRGEAELPRARAALRQARCRRSPRRSRRSTRRTSPPRCATGGTVGDRRSTARSTQLGADDLVLAMQPLEGYQLEREGSHAVALELDLDDELRREGLAREVVHAVQNARKGAGWTVEDRIALTLGGDDELLAAARAHEDYVGRRDAGDVGRLRRRGSTATRGHASRGASCASPSRARRARASSRLAQRSCQVTRARPIAPGAPTVVA